MERLEQSGISRQIHEKFAKTPRADGKRPIIYDNPHSNQTYCESEDEKAHYTNSTDQETYPRPLNDQKSL